MFERLTWGRGWSGGRRVSIFKLLKRLWIPLLILLVVVAGGFTVSRLHGMFGNQNRPVYEDTDVADSQNFDPKFLTYEVFGPPGTVADISYFDVDAEPQYIEGVPLPWSEQFEITGAGGVGNIVAQGTSDTIGCRIIVDGEVKAETIRDGVSAFTYCMLKAA
jgi:hypothetical protein